MAKAAPPIEKLRAWYSQRQGLDGSLKGASPALILRQSGWARSVGSAGPYLTLFSRGGISREAADTAVAKLEIHELPSARNCTYVLPAEDFALGLKAGQTFAGAEMKVAYKLGVTDKEIDKLCEAVVKALEKELLDPNQIREATGSASRSLGPEGKKKGLTTTLPLALGRLQSMGEIRRIPINGRLDQQRYRYTAWRPNPLKGFKLTVDQTAQELARRFFAWIGPATLAEFQTFSGLGVKAAKAATEFLKLEPLDQDDPRLLTADDRAKLDAFQIPKQARYTLVSSLDSLSLLRQDTKSMLDPAALASDFIKSRTAAGEALFDFQHHPILDRGLVVGLWQYDPSTESIAWTAFIKKNRDLETAVKATENYIREQLGDARSFSLDSPQSRAPKIDALRTAKSV